eukprot:TRINITY_DN26662_c0_g1_i3.p2 TRINITY_DN26662_c0_g1~~TRINITY_DN26662_c0_g1_i3.p2  ORF type:complete len:280 (-),score=21.83 TRINITY_DN26662_c0_g1_i3:1538-2254(-)
MRNEDKIKTILQRVRCLDYRFPTNCKASELGKDLVRKLLVLEPNDRLTAREIFSHPWFRYNLPLEDPLKWTEQYVKHAQQVSQQQMESEKVLNQIVQKAQKLYQKVVESQFYVCETQDADGRTVQQWKPMSTSGVANGLTSDNIDQQVQQELDNGSYSRGVSLHSSDSGGRHHPMMSQIETIEESSREGMDSDLQECSGELVSNPIPEPLSGSGFSVLKNLTTSTDQNSSQLKQQVIH